jgi:hypothetical protein
MKIKNLVIVLVLQLIVILGLFAYFYTQKRDMDQVFYLPIINTEDQKDALYFDINTIQKSAFRYDYMSEEYKININNINVDIDDIVYITLDQYGGKINGVRHADTEYRGDGTAPIIKGKVVGITKVKPESGEITTYTIQYGIENIQFEVKSLLGSVAKIELNSNGEPKLLEIYQGHKVIYKFDK